LGNIALAADTISRLGKMKCIQPHKVFATHWSKGALNPQQSWQPPKKVNSFRAKGLMDGIFSPSSLHTIEMLQFNF
jgi:hypothetical protein